MGRSDSLSDKYGGSSSYDKYGQGAYSESKRGYTEYKDYDVDPPYVCFCDAVHTRLGCIVGALAKAVEAVWEWCRLPRFSRRVVEPPRAQRACFIRMMFIWGSFCDTPQRNRKGPLDRASLTFAIPQDPRIAPSMGTVLWLGLIW